MAVAPAPGRHEAVLAGRSVLFLSAAHTFRRRLDSLGARAGTKEYRAVFVTISALETGGLPGVADHETEFSPGRAYVLRVAGHNLVKPETVLRWLSWREARSANHAALE